MSEPIGAPADPAARDLEVQRLFGRPAAPPAADDGWRRWAIDGNHPALVAKLAARIATISGLPVTPVGVAVDTRMFWPDIRSTANFWVVILDVPVGQNWVATHAQLLTVLSERRGRVIGAPEEVLRAPMFLIRAMYQRGERKGSFPSVVDISNLGHVDLAAFSTGDFEATAGYEASPGGLTGADIILVEGNGHTQLTLGWPAVDRGGAADKIMDELCETLAPVANRRYSSFAPSSGPAAGPLDGWSVVQRFRDQVRETPDAIAVSGPAGEVSYAEFERRALAVAETLRAHGVGTESVVGVLADRSVLAVTAIWGVLLAGAAYLPMDTAYPDTRIRTVLAAAGAPVCLVQRPHHERDCRPEGCRPLILDDLPQTPTAPDPPPLAAPGDLAYVVYTSGSTGQPKGVEVEHRPLANFAGWAIREHGIDGSTKIPLLCSLAFDLAEMPLILPLLAGATLLLMPG